MSLYRTEKIMPKRSRFKSHRHGGPRIPNFVRPEEQRERRRRPTQWFSSMQELMRRES